MFCSIKKPSAFIRIIFGLIIILGGIYFDSYFGLFGIFPIIFALSGFCPLCALSCKLSKLYR